MADFFSPGPTNSVSISTPKNQATVLGAVKLIANASESQAVTQMQVWDNGVKLGYYNASQVNATYNLAAGSHTTTVLDLNSTDQIIHQSSVTYTVQEIVPGVQIVAPTANETSPSLVHVVAQGNESEAVGQMQVWDNGVKLGYYASANVNQYFNLAPGSHTITVLDQDNDGNVIHRSSVSYRVSAAPEGVEIATPAPVQSFSTPIVQLVAQANESETVSQVQVWDNGVKLSWFPGSFVNMLFSLAPGSHTVTVLDLGSNNQVLHQSSVSYAVQ
jgi:DNA uptake protein ComE-like DNA-binding protein